MLVERTHDVVLLYNSTSKVEDEEECQKGKSRKGGGTRVPGARLAKLFGTRWVNCLLYAHAQRTSHFLYRHANSLVLGKRI